MSLWGEIRRRNVHRAALAYVAAAWLLIQVVETLFPVFGQSENAIRVVVILLAVGFVPTVVLSWIFEWTPEGFRRDSEIKAPAPVARTRRFDAAIIVMLVLAVAYFAVDKFVLDPSRDAAERETARQEGRADALVESFGDKSIVVLPFVNISSDPEQEYLGDGLAEELLNLLARIEGLRVISRTSAFAFKDKVITSSEIAQLLSVSYVLEGSVRKSGNTLRITAQLIDARADAHVWSDTYDHSDEDIFAIQDSVAGEVVGHLKTELLLDLPKVDRHHPVAYAMYLQAEQLDTSEDTQEKRELLEGALKLEPDYVDAMIELATVHGWSSQVAMWEGDVEAAERHEEQSRLLFDKALALDPNHSAGNATLAWHAFRVPDLPLAAKYAERALESDPTNFGAITTVGEVLVRLGRAERAIPVLRYAADRDPLSSYHFDNLGGAYMSAGQYELAEEAYRVQLILSPEDYFAVWGIGRALILQGNANEALEYLNENLDDQHPLHWHGKTLALHDLGRTDEALSELAKLLELDPGTPGIHWYVGTAYAWIGETDKAFASFEKQREYGAMIFTSVGDSALYANLSNDPRWQPFLASVGRDPDFLASVEFNPTLPSDIHLQ